MTPIQLFLRGCRQRLFRLKVAGTTDEKLSGGLLLAAAVLMRKLLLRTGIVNSKLQMNGVLLPPSVGATLANLAIGLSGKAAVNLDYAFTREGVEGCIEQCGIAHVLTNRRFLKRRPFDLSVELVFLEDQIPLTSLGKVDLGAIKRIANHPSAHPERSNPVPLSSPKNDLSAL